MNVMPISAHSFEQRNVIFLTRGFLDVLYSTLLHLPPLRFQYVGGCWDRAQ
jgi:hypothetical protein